MEIWETRTPIWQTFANASFTDDLAFAANATGAIDEDTICFLDDPLKFVTTIGLLVACLADFRNAATKFQLDESPEESEVPKMAARLFDLAIFLFVAPNVLLVSGILLIYRRMVETVLRIKLGEEFVGLLDGTDRVWALEEPAALSVVNVLGFLEKDNDASDQCFLTDFRASMDKLSSTKNLEKLAWSREEKYGYHYWRRGKKICVEQLIRWMEKEQEHERCDDSCRFVDGRSFHNILERASNEKLPGEHSSSWEILIGRGCGKTSSRSGEKIQEIPILFRVHHSLGDGVALLRLLLESIADSENPTPPVIDEAKRIKVPCLRKSSQISGIVRKDDEILYGKCLTRASMPFTLRISLGKIVRTIAGLLDAGLATVQRIFTIFATVSSAPNCLIRQALRSMDKSALHGPALTGEKILSRWTEGDRSSRDGQRPNLLRRIRETKAATGARFGDVVLAALSENLYRYFSKIGESAPRAMTVVVPARMTVPSKTLNLRNDFSVGLLRLCCGEVRDESVSGLVGEENTRLLDRLVDVAESSEKLRGEPDYLINFWVMRSLAGLLPECLLRPVLESRSTLVFSNLPGPRRVSIIGNKLKNVTFWIPHRGTTGLGCSLLTYDGKISLTMMADTALVPNKHLLDEILRNTVADIEKLHDAVSR